MEKMDEHKDDFGNPDTAIMALGSTRKDAGSAEMFRYELKWKSKISTCSCISSFLTCVSKL
jgi:hypothetical protein